MATPNAPPPEAVDLVAYLNEAWTPYHAVLASCKRLMAAGFEASPRARPSFPYLESPNDFSSHPEAGRVRAGGAEFCFPRETNAGSGAATGAVPCDIRGRAWKIPAVFR